MKLPPFDYLAPASLEEATAALVEHGDDAKLLAGGQSLMPLLAFRLARPEVVVDLGRIPELDYIDERGDGTIAIGAMTTTRTAGHAPAIASACPVVTEAIPHIGHPQIRSRGTIGGSLVHADPAAELPVLALLLGAVMVVSGPGGQREIPASEFFVTFLTTNIEPDEIMVEVRWPTQRLPSGQAFHEVARRRGDFALVSAGAAVTLAADGTCADASVVLGGVADTPVDRSALARGAIGRKIDQHLLREIGMEVAESLSPPNDVHATARYRRHVASVLTQRALADAARRAGTEVVQ